MIFDINFNYISEDQKKNCFPFHPTTKRTDFNRSVVLYFQRNKNRFKSLNFVCIKRIHQNWNDDLDRIGSV